MPWALPDDALDAMRALDGVTAHAVDVRDTAALTRTLTEIVIGNEVDVLVNNAGIIGDLLPAQQSSSVVADALIDVNLRAAVHATTRRACREWSGATNGHIVFTGSIAGDATRPRTLPSTRRRRRPCRPLPTDCGWTSTAQRVRVTVLTPGRVETNLYDEALGGHDAAVTRLYSGATAVQPADIAALVAMALAMPEHVDVTRIEVVPTMQVFGGSAIAQME